MCMPMCHAVSIMHGAGGHVGMPFHYWFRIWSAVLVSYLIVLDMHVYIYIHDSFVIWIHKKKLKSINMYINNSSSLFS